jgi:hypothetical protein
MTPEAADALERTVSVTYAKLGTGTIDPQRRLG